MKTTLDLPEDLMREMKIRAATQGRKLKDVMADAIRDSLATKSSAKTLRIVTPANGALAYFDCDPPSNAVPSVEELQKVMEQSQHEEDLQRVGIAF